MKSYFYETNSGINGYIDSETIEQAREIFFSEHPDIAPDCAGIFDPQDPEYPHD